MERETRGKLEMDGGGEVNEDVGSLSASTLKLYETQFFGFTPQTCMLRVYSAFQDCLYDILPVMEKVCVRQLSKGESDGAELLHSRARECSRKLQQFLEDRFKQLSERMEALLVNRCFSIPPNVLLPEDKSHNSCPQDIQVGPGALKWAKWIYFWLYFSWILTQTKWNRAKGPILFPQYAC